MKRYDLSPSAKRKLPAKKPRVAPEGAPAYTLGFESMESEVEVDQAPVSGSIPKWISGTLVRTGPALFEVGDQKFNHWFDGLGMLHRFSVHDGQVSYGNKFIQSRAYMYAMENDQISFREFATNPDPERFHHVSQGYEAHGTDNAIVNVVQIQNKVLAMTQMPLAIEIDPATLKTIGTHDYEDNLPDGFTTPHPHVDPEEGYLYNWTISLDPPVSHNLYRMNTKTGERELMTTLKSEAPAFVNSFAMTERYIILVEQPFLLDYMALIKGDKAFINCFDWRPEEPTIFWVVDKSDGEVVRRFDTDAFFFLHHINAYQTDDEFIVDMVTYKDPEIINALYLDKLRAGGEIPLPQPRRFKLNLLDDSVTSEPLRDAFMELPRINYEKVNGKPYRYFYGFGGYGSLLGSEKLTFEYANSLVKVDIDGGKSQTWQSANCYPGEPVFVAEPDARAEDDGVLMSVVLDTAVGKSFLLVLDARTMTEVGRAGLPHHVPFTLGGNFFSDLDLEPQDLGFADTRQGDPLPESLSPEVSGRWQKLLGIK